ncbi:hypothetical protein ACFX1Z_018084 [Malus domestica]
MKMETFTILAIGFLKTEKKGKLEDEAWEETIRRRLEIWLSLISWRENLRCPGAGFGPRKHGGHHGCGGRSVEN